MKAFFQSLFNVIVQFFSGLKAHSPRMTLWTLISVGLLAAVIAIRPDQISVVVWKLLLIALAAPMAYWLDRALFPYARPHELDPDTGQRDVAMFRRALVFTACVLGLALGL